MQTLLELEGIDGAIWTLEQVEGELYVTHIFNDDDMAPRTTIPVDMYVLAAMAKAARPAVIALPPLQHPEWRTVQ